MTRYYQTISGDGHVETPPLWNKYVPEKWQDRAPRLVNLEEGGEGWLIEGMPMLKNGQNITGKLDAQGYARHENVPEKAVKVEYAPLESREDSTWEPLRHLIDAARNKLG